MARAAFANLAAAMALIVIALAPIAIIRTVGLGSDGFLAAPSSEIGIAGPPIAALLGFFGLRAFAGAEAVEGRRSLRRYGLWAAAPALALFCVYLSNVTSWWVATPQGVVTHGPLLGGVVLHSWRDLETREASCHRTKSGETAFSADLRFRDGLDIHVAGANRSPAVAAFPKLFDLTSGAQSVGKAVRLLDCPDGVVNYIAAW